MSSFETRLVFLERENKRMKSLALLITLGSACAALIGAKLPGKDMGEIVARSVVVVDEHGKPAVSITATNGIAEVRLQGGKLPKLRLTADKDGAAIKLFASDEMSSSSMHLSAEAGELGVMLNGQHSNIDMRIPAGDRGDSYLAIKNYKHDTAALGVWGGNGYVDIANNDGMKKWSTKK